MPTQAEAATLAAPRDECTTAVPSGDVAFHSQVAHLRSSPPDQAIWSAGLDAALAGRRLFTHGGRTISSTAITALWGRLYGKSSRGVVMTTAEQLADLAGLSERQTLTGLAVMRELQLISCAAPQRGFATRLELQPGGMTWLMARRVVATAVASNRAADVARIEEQKEPATDRSERPRSPDTPDTMSGAGDTMSSPWVHEKIRTTPPTRARYATTDEKTEKPELPPGTATPGSQPSDSTPPATTPAGEKHDELPPGTATPGSQPSDSTPPATTPAPAPAIARPSTAAQRLYAADLGVTVDDLDIGSAGHAIAAARVKLFVSDAQTATAAQEAARGRRAPQTRAGAGRARLANRFVGGHPPPGPEEKALDEKRRREREELEEKQGADPAFIRSDKRSRLEGCLRLDKDPTWGHRLPPSAFVEWRRLLAEVNAMTDEDLLEKYGRRTKRRKSA